MEKKTICRRNWSRMVPRPIPVTMATIITAKICRAWLCRWLFSHRAQAPWWARRRPTTSLSRKSLPRLTISGMLSAAPPMLTLLWERECPPPCSRRSETGLKASIHCPAIRQTHTRRLHELMSSISSWLSGCRFASKGAPFARGAFWQIRQTLFLNALPVSRIRFSILQPCEDLLEYCETRLEARLFGHVHHEFRIAFLSSIEKLPFCLSPSCPISAYIKFATHYDFLPATLSSDYKSSWIWHLCRRVQAVMQRSDQQENDIIRLRIAPTYPRYFGVVKFDDNCL